VLIVNKVKLSYETESLIEGKTEKSFLKIAALAKHVLTIITKICINVKRFRKDVILSVFFFRSVITNII
jgi:hypothetical protein